MEFIKLYFLRDFEGDLRLQPDIPVLPHAQQDHAGKLLILGLVAPLKFVIPCHPRKDGGKAGI